MNHEELVAAFVAKAQAVNAVVQELPDMAAALDYVVDICEKKAPAEMLADEPGTAQGPPGAQQGVYPDSREIGRASCRERV